MTLLYLDALYKSIDFLLSFGDVLFCTERV